jgi:signal transduction histidine kinase
MATGTRTQTGSRPFLAGEMLGPAERVHFEQLLQWLRLSLLITPLLVLVASGPRALPVAVWIVVAVTASFTSVELLVRYRPALLLRTQLAQRVVECGLIYAVLVQYHAFLHNAYYDAVYVLCVGAATATHGRRGGWAIAGLAGLAILAGRLQLIAADVIGYDARHVGDAILYATCFVATASGIDFLMRTSAEVGLRREDAWRAELSARNQELAHIAHERSQAIQLRDAQLLSLTHDLRHPLTVIRIRARLLRRSVAARYLESVEHIERAAIRMTNGIDELLETVSAPAGQDLPLVLVSTDLVQLVRDAIDEYHDSIRHRLVLDARESSIAGQFDPQRLERAFDNLVVNAIRYSPAGGDIRLEVSAGADWAKVVIRDQGIGIPAQDLPHVFEPGRRGGNVVGRIEGTGIGLANARQIVEQHGGALSVESAPGEGSTFIVRLPLAPMPV